MKDDASNRAPGGLRAAPARMARRLFGVLRCRRATLSEIAEDPGAQYEALLLTALFALLSAGCYGAQPGQGPPALPEWLAIALLRCLGLLPTALAMWLAGRMLRSRAPFAAWFRSFAYASLPGVAAFPLYLVSPDITLASASTLVQNSIHAAMLIAYPFALLGNPGRLLRLPLHEWVYFGVFCWQALIFLCAARDVLKSTLPAAVLCIAAAGALCTALAFLVTRMPVN